MNLNKNYILFIIPLLLFLSKWALSYIVFPNDFLITKILFDTPDSQYYPIVKSLANFDFYPSFNDSIKTENILTFPYGAIILHSLFYKIFGNISFIILEYVFTLLFFVIIFKIFKEIGFSFSSAVCGTLLILFLPTFSKLLLNFPIPYIENLHSLTNYIFSVRFPRPQVTGFYYFLFIYLSLKFSIDIENNSNKKYAIYFAVLLGVIANSFFYFFIYFTLALLILLFTEYKKNILSYLISKIKFFLIFISIFFIFLVPFFLQLYLGEVEHSARMGLVKIDMEDKIYLNKFFFKSIFRFEPLLLFFTSVMLTIIIKKKFYRENLFNKISFLFYLYIASIITPFLFITFSPKVIALYHFADYILVNGFLYILIGSTSIVYFYLLRINKNKIFIQINLIKTLFVSIVLFLFFFQNYQATIINDDRNHFNKINQILIDNNLLNSKLYLFTNDSTIANLWTLSLNKNLIISDGFTNAIKDKEIIENLSIGLKMIGINREEFKEILDFKGPHYTQRNPLIIHLFNYKYQANKFHQFADNEQYTNIEIEQIKKRSPLRVMANILPNNEKNKFLNIFDNTSFNENNYKDYIVILNTELIPDFFKSKNFDKLNTLYKKDNYIILRKN